MSALNNRTPSPRRTLFAWIGLLIYACIVTFPHQFVQDFVSKLTDRYTNERVWAVSVKAAELEGALLILFVAIALFRLRGWVERGWLATYLLLSVFLLFFSWRMFMINNMELVHFPQYFPEGIALVAMTGSAAESLAWIAILGSLDEGFQYASLAAARQGPFDFNDVYMDIAGGAAGIVLGLAWIGCVRRDDVRGWVKQVFARPGIRVLTGIVAAGMLLLATGRMVLYEKLSPPGYWFGLSREPNPGSPYFRPWVFGLHHFHEMTPLEGTLAIAGTIALFALLDRNLICKVRVFPKKAESR